PEARPRRAAVRTLHDAASLDRERRDHSFEVVARHLHVAVGDHEIIVTRVRHHIDQVADLGVRAVLARVGGDLEIESGKIALQLAHGREGRIAGVAHPENDLKIGVTLLAEGAQPLVQAVLRAAERLEDRHCRHRLSPWLPRQQAPRIRRPSQRNTGEGGVARGERRESGPRYCRAALWGGYHLPGLW